MTGGNVQGREVVPLVLDLRPLGRGETHASEDVDNLVNGPAQNVSTALWEVRTGLGHIDLRSAGDPRAGNLGLPRLESLLERDLDFVQTLADGRLVLLRDGLQLGHHALQPTLGTEIRNPPRFDGLAIGGGSEFGEGSGLKFFEFDEHGRSVRACGVRFQADRCDECPMTKENEPRPEWSRLVVES